MESISTNTRQFQAKLLARYFTNMSQNCHEYVYRFYGVRTYDIAPLPSETSRALRAQAMKLLTAWVVCLLPLITPFSLAHIPTPISFIYGSSSSEVRIFACY